MKTTTSFQPAPQACMFCSLHSQQAPWLEEGRIHCNKKISSEIAWQQGVQRHKGCCGSKTTGIHNINTFVSQCVNGHHNMWGNYMLFCFMNNWYETKTQKTTQDLLLRTLVQLFTMVFCMIPCCPRVRRSSISMVCMIGCCNMMQTCYMHTHANKLLIHIPSSKSTVECHSLTMACLQPRSIFPSAPLGPQCKNMPTRCDATHKTH